MRDTYVYYSCDKEDRAIEEDIPAAIGADFSKRCPM